MLLIVCSQTLGGSPADRASSHLVRTMVAHVDGLSSEALLGVLDACLGWMPRDPPSSQVLAVGAHQRRVLDAFSWKRQRCQLHSR